MGPPPATAAVRLAVRLALADLVAGGDPSTAAPAAGPDPTTGPAGSAPLVLVGCSGGADSLALAAATAFEAPRLGLRAGAVTVDHGLQPGSADRAARLVPVLLGLGLDPVEVLPVQVAGPGGPEAAARRARRAALRGAGARHGAAAVLLAHTRDDQAETVLLGLARGSGARSLAGMAAHDGRWRRPLLDLDRATVRSACLEAGLDPWEDPHNVDPAYTRSRVRSRVLPVLERELGPGIAAALARSAALLRADADLLDALAAEARDRLVLEVGATAPGEARTGTGTGEAGAAEPGAAGSVALPVDGLARLHLALRSRVLRAQALDAGCPGTDLTASHVAALERLVSDWHGQGPLHLPGGVEARRRHGRIELGPSTHGAARPVG